VSDGLFLHIVLRTDRSQPAVDEVFSSGCTSILSGSVPLEVNDSFVSILDSPCRTERCDDSRFTAMQQ
jgi:hypothetical protein